MEVENAVRDSDKIMKYLVSGKLKKRIKYICSKFGRSNDYEDVYQSYCLLILEGKAHNQTLDQFFVDHSIKNGWYKRKGVKKDLPKFTTFEDFKVAGVLDDCSMVFEVFKLLPPQKRIIMFLVFKYNFTNAEIGECLGVSESRISQIKKYGLVLLQELMEF